MLDMRWVVLSVDRLVETMVVDLVPSLVDSLGCQMAGDLAVLLVRTTVDYSVEW